LQLHRSPPNCEKFYPLLQDVGYSEVIEPGKSSNIGLKLVARDHTVKICSQFWKSLCGTQKLVKAHPYMEVQLRDGNNCRMFTTSVTEIVRILTVQCQSEETNTMYVKRPAQCVQPIVTDG
jgi:hypothetical protein